MQYGSFDDAAKEYVITRPDTPQSWSNYLGSTKYGAIITNNAGGYSFYRSAARGRFTRLMFNNVPLDQPGRYFYLRDKNSRDYWSTSWQPVGKSLEEYQSTCRHGTAYTAIQSVYSGIESEATYFVPLGQHFEYWKLKLFNHSERTRSLSVHSYAELSNRWSTFHDFTNLQYSMFVSKGERAGRFLKVSSHFNVDSIDDPIHEDGKQIVWATLAGAELSGFETAREAFLGSYRSYANPVAVESGKSSNSLVYGDSACMSLTTEVELKPGEGTEFVLLLGIHDLDHASRVCDEFASVEACDRELARLKDDWHAKLGSIRVDTPDTQFNSMVNVWGLYNCLITFAWSRAASLVYQGVRDGLGFRDSVQDILGVAAAITDDAQARLELMLSGQLYNGGAIPVIKPFEHRPGHESAPPLEEYRSDDCLWFFNTVPAMVGETGDVAFLDKVIPYADKGSGTVMEHLRRALEFNLERSGRNGLPCGLKADWNDCLKLGYHGESLFVAFQLRLGLQTYAELSGLLDRESEQEWARAEMASLDEKIQRTCWDGEWFIWAIGEDGTVYGTREYDEGQVYLNTQVWSVISGAATEEQQQKALDTVKRTLATPYGVMLCAPPFSKASIDVMRSVVFLPGIKENGGIFNHTQGWAVIAECIRGDGDAAYAYYRSFMPAAYNDRAEVRQLEPYVQAQTTYSPFSPRPGNARVSWLTGAAPWAYYSATQYIVGVRPEIEGIRIDPCIPSEWKSFQVEREFRGRRMFIDVRNPDAVCRGVRTVTVDGTLIEGNLINAELVQHGSRILVEMG